ncbi:Clavaminate synthase-like protein [Lojkania enalia]|uniref:Clavaminate synthase-like protein n=1 Tax=Lojkania enalia TaxID=147567 RepID=A0A9P4K5X7_9PLEO|nr:Clavaminate synthase-like protein [Didymosphaeria enalia]
MPSLIEIIKLTHSVLLTSQPGDAIRECGRPALSLLSRDPDMCIRLAYQKLHDVPYKEVKACWRRLYTDAALWKALRLLERLEGELRGEPEENDGNEDLTTKIVRVLDMALILAGAPGREEIVELIFSALRGVLEGEQRRDEIGRPSKRRRLDHQDKGPTFQETVMDRFPLTALNEPRFRCPMSRVENISLEAFQSRIEKPDIQPFIITGAINHWPALNERPWAKPSYLLSHTLGGRRLVPIEIGRSYTDQGWGQKIVSFSEFMTKYIAQPHTTSSPQKLLHESSSRSKVDKNEEPNRIGYLAQHDLLTQIPSLRPDLCIPDYCYASPPPHTLPHITSVPKLTEPLLNAWFGPSGTISPLHTDPYHNILAQVVGYKYLRLYAPEETASLHPRGRDENGVDMSNTSSVDLDEAFRCMPAMNPFAVNNASAETLDSTAVSEFLDTYPGFQEAKYVEGVLGPGECMYIPVGWWHYVRSLSPSFSVSFWFN